MKRPKMTIPKRPMSGRGRAARGPKEAAISLVRVEFDVSRLTMGIEQAENRIATYSAELNEKLKERKRLIETVQGQGSI